MAIKCCGRSVIIDDLLNINPESLCTPICLVVTRANQLPDPPEGCEFALVANMNDSAFTYQIWQWTGASWENQTNISGDYVGETIVDVVYVTTGSWVATLNGNEVSGDSTYTFDPAADTLDVVFINGNCSYVMNQIVPPPIQQINFTFDAIANAPVVDPSDVSQWNTYFGLFSTFDQYLSASVLGDTVTLTASAGQVLNGTIFLLNDHIVDIHDEGIFIEATTVIAAVCPFLKSVRFDALVTTGNGAFGDNAGMESIICPVLETIGTTFAINATFMTNFNLPSLKYITGDQNFYLCTSAVEFNFPMLEQLGATVGNDANFFGIIGNNVELTCKSVLATCDGGNPDGDIQYLDANNTATINYV